MIPVGLAPDPAPPLPPPAIVAPAPREVSFGRIAGTADRAARRVVVFVDGRRRGAARVTGGRFALFLPLPPRDVRIRVTAVDGGGNRASAAVFPVFGLPAEAPPAAAVGFEDRVLARIARRLAARFPGTAAFYVQDLRSGAGAAWNARARFPGASTLKLPIAIEALRVLRGPPQPRSAVDRLLRAMLVQSDNEAANELEAWIGGSVAGGAARVNATMEALGLRDSHLYGGFLASGGRRPLPLTVESQPRFGVEKYTTAWDLARLHRFLHLAADGRGPLVEGLPGAFTAADARYLLYVLAHSADRGKKLDRYLRGRAVVLHKAGWITHARHDAGLVYWRGGAFVAAVMTWSGSGVGKAADVLAGRVADAALERFDAPRPRDGRGPGVLARLAALRWA